MRTATALLFVFVACAAVVRATDCPDHHFYNAATYKCEKTSPCDDGHYYNTNTYKCEKHTGDKCSLYHYFDPVEYACKPYPLCKADEYYDLSSYKCQVYCPGKDGYSHGKFFDGHCECDYGYLPSAAYAQDCYNKVDEKYCDKGFYYDDGKAGCYKVPDTCEANHYYSSTTYKCEPYSKCDEGYVWDSVYYRCIKPCSDKDGKVQGKHHDGKCFCKSGWAPSYYGALDCKLTPYDCSGKPLVPDYTTTVGAPELVYGKLMNNKLKLTVEMPLVQDRYVNDVQLGSFTNDFKGASNPYCTYKGPYGWRKEVGASYTGQCVDRFVALIDWMTVVADDGCALALDNYDPMYYKYAGEIKVLFTDYLPQTDLSVARGQYFTRDTESSFNVHILIQKQIHLEINNKGKNYVTLFDDVRIEVVVTSQYHTFDAGYAASGVDRVQIIQTTSVQWPFVLEYYEITYHPERPYVDVVADPHATSSNDACAGYENSGTCVQTWTYDILPMPDYKVCYLSGDYSVKWQVHCNDDFKGECPIDSYTGMDAYSTATLDIESLCNDVEIQKDLTGTFSSFKDITYYYPREAFFKSETMFFQACVSSTALKIGDVQLTDLVAVNGYTYDKVVLVYDGAVADNVPADMVYLDLTPDNDKADLYACTYFSVNAIYFGRYEEGGNGWVPLDSMNKLEMFATLKVTYHDLVYKKRSHVMQVRAVERALGDAPVDPSVPQDTRQTLSSSPTVLDSPSAERVAAAQSSAEPSSSSFPVAAVVASTIGGVALVVVIVAAVAYKATSGASKPLAVTGGAPMVEHTTTGVSSDLGHDSDDGSRSGSTGVRRRV